MWNRQALERFQNVRADQVLLHEGEPDQLFEHLINNSSHLGDVTGDTCAVQLPWCVQLLQVLT
jgi:hypothetical protein